MTYSGSSAFAGARPDPWGFICPRCRGSRCGSDKGTLVCRSPGLEWRNCGPGCDWRGTWADVPPPHFSSDMNAVAAVEKRIARLKRTKWYADALERMVPAASLCDARWRLIHATAEQRCRAALEAVAPRPRWRER